MYECLLQWRVYYNCIVFLMCICVSVSTQTDHCNFWARTNIVKLFLPRFRYSRRRGQRPPAGTRHVGLCSLAGRGGGMWVSRMHVCKLSSLNLLIPGQISVPLKHTFSGTGGAPDLTSSSLLNLGLKGHFAPFRVTLAPFFLYIFLLRGQRRVCLYRALDSVNGQCIS